MKSTESKEILESNGTLLREFVTTSQNYATHRWSYLLLNFSIEYQDLSTKTLWFVQLLSCFSSWHLPHLQQAMAPVLRSVWEHKLFFNFHPQLSFQMVFQHVKGQEGREEWQLALPSLVFYVEHHFLDTISSSLISQLKQFWKQMSKQVSCFPLSL